MAAVGLCVAVALAACGTKPIYNVNAAPVTSATGKALTASQVRTAIVNAGVSLGWAMTEPKPGVMLGTLNLREHTAVVEIPYSEKSYSILYKSSVNLKESGGNIHNNYNGWIQNLDNRIRAELTRQ